MYFRYGSFRLLAYCYLNIDQPWNRLIFVSFAMYFRCKGWFHLLVPCSLLAVTSHCMFFLVSDKWFYCRQECIMSWKHAIRFYLLLLKLAVDLEQSHNKLDLRMIFWILIKSEHFLICVSYAVFVRLTGWCHSLDPSIYLSAFKI